MLSRGSTLLRLQRLRTHIICMDGVAIRKDNLALEIEQVIPLQNKLVHCQIGLLQLAGLTLQSQLKQTVLYGHGEKVLRVVWG